ncbi:type II secretion system protein [Desulfamplus magnetovallimortis]|uniref:type II secretion system protein n=1 Tax=Desulfamplus magnetovallimortis TaxID=1246637 RepID=UPI001C970985|nr:prepilin-type N-terminal cleavage/methylation domain-containing protein [Desulfamplus magnetovallimortis]
MKCADIFKCEGNKGARGFTLIEMLIVVSIMGILASIAMPSFQKNIIQSREASLKNTLFVLRDVIDQYNADNGHYPETLDALVENNYIRTLPVDPFTKTTTSWITVLSDQEGETGIYDVHSGSYKVSLDGVPYNEW